MTDNAEWGQIPDYAEVDAMFHEVLVEAEAHFGPRNPRWKNVIVRFNATVSEPRTDNDGDSTITVWLNPGRSRIGYCYEAAHEAVHCLNPVTLHESTYLEESIAVVFSLRMVYSRYGKYGVSKCTLSDKYREAVRQVERVDRDIISLGQRVRERIDFGSLSLDVTPEVLSELYPGILGNVLASLCDKVW